MADNKRPPIKAEAGKNAGGANIEKPIGGGFESEASAFTGPSQEVDVGFLTNKDYQDPRFMNALASGYTFIPTQTPSKFLNTPAQHTDAQTFEPKELVKRKRSALEKILQNF